MVFGFEYAIWIIVFGIFLLAIVFFMVYFNRGKKIGLIAIKLIVVGIWFLVEPYVLDYLVLTYASDLSNVAIVFLDLLLKLLPVAIFLFI